MPLLEVVLEALKEKMAENDSPIFYRLNKNKMDRSYEIFLPSIMKELKNSEQYDFLRDHAAFEALINKYESK